MNTAPTLSYRIVYEFAGIRNGRASSAFDRFADANRAAMTACGAQNRAMRVYAFAGACADLVAEYVPVNGRPQSVPVEVSK